MKNYEITKEVILKYDMREEFPDIFKKELEIGKWYKITTQWDYLIFIEKIESNIVIGYGFNYDGSFFVSCCEWCDIKDINNNELATPQEIETALIAEAKKRGFVKGCEWECYSAYNGELYQYNNETNILKLQGASIFNDGKWAKIIETITKEEAEKILNKKIV